MPASAGRSEEAVSYTHLPDMAAGNFIGKSWVIQGGGRMTGLVVGAKAPIVLTSRGSGADEKFYSIVFAAAASK